MSDWQRVLVVCALLAGAVCITIGVISDIRRRQRLADPDPRCVVRNHREPL